MDFVDFFDEELKHKQNPSLSYHASPIDSCIREMVERLDNDIPSQHRPTYRGPAPSEHEVESPIMPCEHWLADEQPGPLPVAKSSNRATFATRISLRTRPCPREDKSHDESASDSVFQAFTNLAENTILRPTSTQICAAKVLGNSVPSGTDICFSLALRPATVTAVYSNHVFAQYCSLRDSF